MVLMIVDPNVWAKGKPGQYAHLVHDYYADKR